MTTVADSTNRFANVDTDVLVRCLRRVASQNLPVHSSLIDLKDQCAAAADRLEALYHAQQPGTEPPGGDPGAEQDGAPV